MADNLWFPFGSSKLQRAAEIGLSICVTLGLLLYVPLIFPRVMHEWFHISNKQAALYVKNAMSVQNHIGVINSTMPLKKMSALENII